MARDTYHELVKEALIVDGWTVTDDPLLIELSTSYLEIDLGAERLIGATRGKEKIAVEIKSFIARSQISEFYKALGQYNFYHLALEEHEPDRKLYLAIPEGAYNALQREALTLKATLRFQLKFILYSIEQKKIVKWTG